MKKPGLITAFGFAARGLAYTWKTQRNLRIQAAVAALVLAAGAALQVTRLDWALLVFAIALVFAAELLNTAVEALVDLVSPLSHPLAGAAKDACAAAVVVAVLGAVVIGVLVLGPPLLARLNLVPGA